MERTDLYDHKNPPRKPAVPKPEDAAGTLCPLSRRSCLGLRCAWWDEDWKGCSVNAFSYHNQTRTAITDALTEVKSVYDDDRR